MSRSTVSHSYSHGGFTNFWIICRAFIFIEKFIFVYTPGKTSEALSKLMDLQASTAILLEMSPVLEADGTTRVIGEREINTNLLKRNDIIKVCSHFSGSVVCNLQLYMVCCQKSFILASFI